MGAGLYSNVVEAAAFSNGTLLARLRLPNAMPGGLLIAAGPGEWRAALLEDGIPVELIISEEIRRSRQHHLGRVHRLLPALAAIRRYRQRSTSVPTPE